MADTHITVPSVFPSGNSTSAFLCDPLSDGGVNVLPDVGTGGVGCKRHRRDCINVSLDEPALSCIPRGEQLGGRSCTN